MNDRYRLLDLVGEGSFGLVYRAFDNVQYLDVAIKFLKKNSADDITELAHEALVLNNLSHPFIVDLLDYDINAPDPYIVVEYCDKGSLRSQVGRLRLPTVTRILAQVAQGLRRIHECGGYHRDLKPENLLLKTHWTTICVKIADFGVARIPGVGSGMTHGPRGTRGYIAPEVLEGHPFTAAADIYSLGVVATELLTGDRDLHHLNTIDMPPWLRGALLSMRSPVPEHRPTARRLMNLLRKDAQATHPNTSLSVLEID